MGFGGYHPFPRRFGGNRHNGKPLTQVVHDSLNAQRPPAYNTEEGTIVSLENKAAARAIALDGWEFNERLAAQLNPTKATYTLERWCAIFAIPQLSGQTDVDRRELLTQRWQRFGHVAHHAAIVAALSSELGAFFVALEYILPTNAVVAVPDSGYPWGTVVADTWSSTVAHFLARMQRPVGASEGDFYDAAGKVPVIMDSLVSSFVTFDWYRPGDVSTPIAGSVSAAGFYLDDGHNLDNEVFD